MKKSTVWIKSLKKSDCSRKLCRLKDWKDWTIWKVQKRLKDLYAKDLMIFRLKDLKGWEFEKNDRFESSESLKDWKSW